MSYYHGAITREYQTPFLQVNRKMNWLYVNPFTAMVVVTSLEKDQ